ncbi:spore coat U domain-containing protein [Hydrogenimonas thermophila]|uniref:Csu type fimbrial protein n=1 Tax=Hydrogenimonas thermophila TaxID=223786 RepID=UPI0029373A66|nr:spore coat U domain-containing protein [Hydrogenimonas thermophila]WOE70502.1 spore coat U domain-containing protein [Hydrogenimonas thermophila]WOE73018.1 spore coat U domain-containing protein [Hydrogenimonas thermophila]
MKKALALTMIASTLVFAGTTTSSTTVTATTEPTCSIANSPTLSLDFNGLSDSTSSFNVDIVCSSGLAYTMTVDGGANPSGELRRATDGTNFITYRLFSDAAMTTELGAATGNQITGSGTDNLETINIYTKVAIVDNSPLPPIGTYSDTLTVTLSW